MPHHAYCRASASIVFLSIGGFHLVSGRAFLFLTNGKPCIHQLGGIQTDSLFSQLGILLRIYAITAQMEQDEKHRVLTPNRHPNTAPAGEPVPLQKHCSIWCGGRTRLLTLRSKVIWLQLSFELVAAKCHRHLAFGWVRILSLDNEKKGRLGDPFFRCHNSTL